MRAAGVLLCIAAAAPAAPASEQVWNKPYPVVELPIQPRQPPIAEVAWSRDGAAIAWWPAAADDKDVNAVRAAKRDGRMFRFSDLTLRRNPPAEEFWPSSAVTSPAQPQPGRETIVATAVWPRSRGDDSFLQVEVLTDQSLRIWHSFRGTVLQLFVADQDWLSITPEGYYDGSAGGKRLLKWKIRKGPSEQPEALEPSDAFLAQMHRPDLVRGVVHAFQQDFLPDMDYALPWIAADLLRRQASDRKYARYLVATHIHNESMFETVPRDKRWSTGTMVPKIYAALSFLLNSLSWQVQTRLPERVDPAGTIFHIDLRHYGWDERTWQRVVAQYPYGLKRAGDAARAIESATGSELAFLRADWFVFAASQAPLYHDILNLPRTAAKLERWLQVDVAKNLRTAPPGVVRAGFSDSGVSFSNRLIERHPLANGLEFRLGAADRTVRYPDGGYYWKSYDFETNRGRQNLFAFPLGPGEGADVFNHSAGEVIFSLPNGLQAYLLLDRDGTRIDAAPIEIVSDVPILPRKPTVTTAFSCIICHLEGPRATMVPNPISGGDQVRPHFEANAQRYPYSNADSDSIRALYRSKADFDSLFEDDVRRFKTAGSRVTNNISAIAATIRSYLVPLKASRLAAELDQPHEGAFEPPTSFGRNVGPVHLGGGLIKRQVVEEHFAEMAQELKLGEPLRPSAPPVNQDPIPATPFAWLLHGTVALCVLVGLLALMALWALAAPLLART